MRAIADLWVVAIVLGIPLLIIMSVIALAGETLVSS